MVVEPDASDRTGRGRSIVTFVLWADAVWTIVVGILVAFRIQTVPALFIPILLCVPPLVASGPRVRRWVTAIAFILMAIFCLLGSFTVGVYYVPTALLLLLAFVLERPLHGSAASPR